MDGRHLPVNLTNLAVVTGLAVVGTAILAFLLNLLSGLNIPIVSTIGSGGKALLALPAQLAA